MPVITKITQSSIRELDKIVARLELWQNKYPLAADPDNRQRTQTAKSELISLLRVLEESCQR